jgi:multidrug transporter EmrE-like cation transporter
LSLPGVLLVFTSALLTAIANLMLRRGILSVAAAGISGLATVRSLLLNAGFVTGILLYGLAALVWFRVLPMEKLSNSYPLLVSLTFFMVTIGAVLVFHEQLSARKIIGLFAIVAGIVLVARA